MTSLSKQHPRLALAGLANTLQERHITAGNAVVVALQHHMAVRVGADHGNRLELAHVKGQDTIVFQQYHTAAGRFQRQLGVRVAIQLHGIDVVIGAILGKHAQPNTRRHHMHRGLTNLRFGHASLLQRRQ